MRKRDVIKQYYQQEILNTAENLFLEKGFNHVSMDMIAKEAKCSKATLYAYFENKDELYQYIILNGMKLLKKMIFDAVNKEADCIDRYYSICYAIADYADEYPLYFQAALANAERDDTSRPVYQALWQIGEETNQLLIDYIKEGIEKGIFSSSLVLPDIIFVFWASLSGIVMMGKNKQQYFKTIMKEGNFFHYSFSLLLMLLTEKK